jgi:hypothetical protein
MNSQVQTREEKNDSADQWSNWHVEQQKLFLQVEKE